MQRMQLAVIAVTMTVAACQGRSASTEKRYSLHGTIVAIDRGRAELTVQHGDIPGFMSAMTMTYAVADLTVLDRVVAGDEIRAELVVRGDTPWLEHVAVVKRAGKGAGPLDLLPPARVDVDSSGHEVIIELPPVSLGGQRPGQAMAMVLEPVFRAVLPVGGAFYSARIELVDSAGARLPQTLLHHFNLSDPSRRELFLPIELHLMAASKETPALSLPGFLFALPFTPGEQLLASAMLGNTSAVPYPAVRVRLRLRYEEQSGLWPLYPVYPWVMDVMFPLGHGPGGSKAFDLPPGRTKRSFEGSPAVGGTIVGLGGHIHDYGVGLELTDVTTGQLLWRGTPVRDSAGHVLSMPVSMFFNWHRLGLRVEPTHRYRVTVAYDNPTGRLIRNGGMGAVGGVLVPDRGARWPRVDPSDPVYRTDLRATLRVEAGAHSDMMDMDDGGGTMRAMRP